MLEKDLEEMLTSAIRYYARKCKKLSNDQPHMKASENKIAELKRKLTNLKTQKMALYESYCDGEITKEVYLSKKTDLDIQIQETSKLVENRGTSDVKPTELNSLFKNISTDTLTKELIESLVSKIIFYDADEVCIEFRPLPGTCEPLTTRWSMVRAPKMVV